jgi:hypothetical protein
MKETSHMLQVKIGDSGEKNVSNDPCFGNCKAKKAPYWFWPIYWLFFWLGTLLIFGIFKT